MSTEDLASASAAVAAATTDDERAAANALLATTVANVLAAVPADQSLASGPYHERYKLARQQIPSFTGKADYSSESLMVKIKAAVATYAINPSDWVKLTLSSLDGRATEFQQELDNEAKEPGAVPLTFDQLEQRLKQRFPVATEDSPQFIMCHKLAFQGNNMAQYVSHFNQQVSRAGTGEAANQALLQEVFLSKLGKDLRLAVEQSRPEQGWTGLSAVQAATVRAHNTLHLRGAQPSGSNSSQGSGQAKRPNRDSGPPAKRSRLASDTKWCDRHKTNTHDTSECYALKHREGDGGFQGRGGGRSGGRGSGRHQSKKLTGSSPGQGESLVTGQVTPDPLNFAHLQVHSLAEVGNLSIQDIEVEGSVAIAADEAQYGVALKAGWVTTLEEKTNCKFDIFYNCYIQGRTLDTRLIHSVISKPDRREGTRGFLTWWS